MICERTKKSLLNEFSFKAKLTLFNLHVFLWCRHVAISKNEILIDIVCQSFFPANFCANIVSFERNFVEELNFKANFSVITQ